MHGPQNAFPMTTHEPHFQWQQLHSHPDENTDLTGNNLFWFSMSLNTMQRKWYNTATIFSFSIMIGWTDPRLAGHSTQLWVEEMKFIPFSHLFFTKETNIQEAMDTANKSYNMPLIWHPFFICKYDCPIPWRAWHVRSRFPLLNSPEISYNK